MNESKPRRKLAAILAADVVNFSALMGENEDRTLRNLKACRALTDDCITANHGRIFGSAGDSIIAAIASPVDAVVAAAEIERYPERAAASLQNGKIEIDEIPAAEDVRVEGANAGGGSFQQLALVCMAVQLGRVLGCRLTDDVDLFNTIN